GKMDAAVKQDELLGAPFTRVGKAAEHAPGRIVVRGDGGFDVLHVGAVIALEQLGQHALGQALAACLFVDCDLPDKQRVLLFRRNIGGDESDQVVVHFSGDAGICKVRALQQ